MEDLLLESELLEQTLFFVAVEAKDLVQELKRLSEEVEELRKLAGDALPFQTARPIDVELEYKYFT